MTKLKTNMVIICRDFLLIVDSSSGLEEIGNSEDIQKWSRKYKWRERQREKEGFVHIFIFLFSS